ncbi:MAG: hypothetical protein Devi2KO_37900 [Devosia indica]
MATQDHTALGDEITPAPRTLTFGAYPTSTAWDGVYSQFGASRNAWIRGLAPVYIPDLPVDPRHHSDPTAQYLYLSDGKDYKIVAHRPLDCRVFTEAHPEMSDPRRLYAPGDERYCYAVGIWSEGAQNW